MQEVGTLSEAEHAQLIEFLIERSPVSFTEEEDAAVGQRGLMAWTESAGHEDWTEFYPEGLNDGGASPQ